MGTTVPPPERLNFAAHLLALNEARAGSAAYVDDRGMLAYGELDRSVRRLAGALLELGLRREQRVLLLAHDRAEWPIAFLAAMYAGLIPVPVNTLLTAEDHAYVLDHSDASAVIVGAELLATLVSARRLASHGHLGPVIVVGGDASRSFASDSTPSSGAFSGAPLSPACDRALPSAASNDAPLSPASDGAPPCPAFAPLRFEDLIREGDERYPGASTHRDSAAFWLYSSGSTGRPKGVVHTHANLWWTAELYGKSVMGIRATDRVFSAAKLFFAYGLGNALTFPLSVGASAVLMAERPTPAAVLTRLLEHEPTIFCAAPTLYASLLAAEPEKRPTKLRLCTSAGEALPAEIGAKFSRRFGADIIDGLGSTEMLHIFISNRPSDVRYGTSGKPVDGYEVQLRDEAGNILGSDQIGDLWVKGPSCALLYWNDRVKSQATFQGEWLRTGDKYVRRADGCYVYAGRNDDMIKISGQYVSPFEVESTLMQHPFVLESGVVAVLDEAGIARSKAFVVLKEGRPPSDAVAQELKAFVKERLAPFKRPQFVEFVEDLPKTATGKIQRFRLRERANPIQSAT
jgi:benzoate-CoA ligase